MGRLRGAWGGDFQNDPGCKGGLSRHSQGKGLRAPLPGFQRGRGGTRAKFAWGSTFFPV